LRNPLESKLPLAYLCEPKYFLKDILGVKLFENYEGSFKNAIH
jgi:hypothetical protein